MHTKSNMVFQQLVLATVAGAVLLVLRRSCHRGRVCAMLCRLLLLLPPPGGPPLLLLLLYQAMLLCVEGHQRDRAACCRSLAATCRSVMTSWLTLTL